MNNPRVSIIILNWNGLTDTIECIRSIKKADYNNFEIIVVDNASKNNEAGELKSIFGDYINIIKNEKNLGFTGGNNTAFEKVIKDNRSKYVLLLNNDTVVDKNFLGELIEVGENDEKIGMMGSKIMYYDRPKIIWSAGGSVSRIFKKVKNIGINKEDGSNYSVSREFEYLSGCSLLIRSDLIKKIGGFDDIFFTYFDETDLCFRAREKGYKLLFVPKSIIFHKVSKSTGVRSDFTIYYLARNRIIFLRKHSGNFIYYIAALLYLFLVDQLYEILINQGYKKIPSFVKGTYAGLRIKISKDTIPDYQ